MRGWAEPDRTFWPLVQYPLGFATQLSKAGVRYLAASPETMIAPGVPTNVAEAIANNEGDANAMGRAVVRDVMHTAYDAGPLGTFGPAAAFDMLDLDSQKIGSAERAIKRLNDALVGAARDRNVRSEIRSDIRSVDGMARIPESTPDMPWHADRPAIAVYDKLANDRRLDLQIRSDAKTASNSVRNLVLAHAESRGFDPFGGADYSDAAGPTVHLPTSQGQVDPWAPFGVRETDNAFYHATDGATLARAVA